MEPRRTITEAPDDASTEARRELESLARSLRAHMELLAGSGAWGVPTDEVPAPSGTARPKGPTTLAAEEPPPARAPARVDALASAAAVTPKVAEAAASPIVRLPQAGLARLAELAVETSSCTRCALHAGRTQSVFARGSGASGLVFVGEGPGEEEDRQGLPFVGPAGQLLDRMIAAMQLARDDVYVCNIVKCRPPKNRKPDLEEMSRCMPFLDEQLAILQPRVIVALGATAVQGLLGTPEGITRLRGQWKLYRGKVPVMPTFHPAYLLRTPAAKREVWKDLQEVSRQLLSNREDAPK